MQLRNKIPTIYHKFLPELLTIEIPDEKIARCDSCNLCQNEKSPYLVAKCCNYHPIQANYLVGGVLNSSDEPKHFGKNKLTEQLTQKKGVSPLGILPPLAYQKNQETILQRSTSFHSAEELESQLCPYYDNGSCSVWNYREHLCISYFCSSSGGEAGKTFWAAVNQFFTEIEQLLAQFAAEKLGAIIPENMNLGAAISSEWNETKAWAFWNESNHSFFIQAYLLISKLKPAEFRSLFGTNYVKKIEELNKLAADFRTNELPNILELHDAIKFTQVDAETITLELNNERLFLSPLVLTFIKLFNGQRRTTDVFYKAFEVLLDLSPAVEALRKKGMLV